MNASVMKLRPITSAINIIWWALEQMVEQTDDMVIWGAMVLIMKSL